MRYTYKYDVFIYNSKEYAEWVIDYEKEAKPIEKFKVSVVDIEEPRSSEVFSKVFEELDVSIDDFQRVSETVLVGPLVVEILRSN